MTYAHEEKKRSLREATGEFDPEGTQRRGTLSSACVSRAAPSEENTREPASGCLLNTCGYAMGSLTLPPAGR